MTPEHTGNGEVAQQIRFVTDDEIAKRLGQLEYRLLTAKAEIPGMIRELQDIRHQLERDG